MALARAFGQKSPILLLDEPTSSVDGESARKIMASIKNLRDQGETVIIIIGHNLKELDVADCIIRINSGRIACVGTFGDLVANDAWFAETLVSQTQSAIVT